MFILNDTKVNQFLYWVYPKKKNYTLNLISYVLKSPKKSLLPLLPLQIPCWQQTGPQQELKGRVGVKRAHQRSKTGWAWASLIKPNKPILNKQIPYAVSETWKSLVSTARSIVNCVGVQAKQSKKNLRERTWRNERHGFKRKHQSQ